MIFESEIVIYDGDYHSLRAANPPNDTKIVYTNNNQKESGTYEITATLNKLGYRELTLYASLVIKKALIDLSHLEFEDVNAVYDGSEKSILLSDLIPDTVDVSYTNNIQVGAGSYLSEVTFSPKDPNNYYLNVTTLSANLNIEKQLIDLSHLTYSNIEKVYDGSELILEVVGEVPETVDIVYTSNRHTVAGSYLSKVEFFPKDPDNYYTNVTELLAIINILKADISAISFNNKTVSFNGEMPTLTIAGTLPSFTTVSYFYTNTNIEFLGESEIGHYLVTAVITGANYNTLTLHASLDIVAIETTGLEFNLINNNTEYEVSKGTASDQYLFIPTHFNNLPVTRIADFGFDGYTNLNSVYFPNTLKELGFLAFHGCSNITNLYMTNSESSTLYVEDNCLIRRSDLSLILGSKNSIIPDYIKRIEGQAFYQRSVFTGVLTLPSGLEYIGDEAFAGCAITGTLIIPNTVTYIGVSAFSDCLQIEEIIVGKSVATIGNNAFQRCSALKAIYLPSSLTSIGSYAFRFCASLLNLYYQGDNASWALIYSSSLYIPASTTIQFNIEY